MAENAAMLHFTVVAVDNRQIGLDCRTSAHPMGKLRTKKNGNRKNEKKMFWLNRGCCQMLSPAFLFTPNNHADIDCLATHWTQTY